MVTKDEILKDLGENKELQERDVLLHTQLQEQLRQLQIAIGERIGVIRYLQAKLKEMEKNEKKYNES